MPTGIYDNFGYCDTNSSCTPITLPDTTNENCKCVTFKGRLNDIFFLSCTEQPTAAQQTDALYWEQMAADGKLRRFGKKGIGGYSVTDVTTEDLGGCGNEETTNITYEITWTQKCIDRSDLNIDHEMADAIIKCGLQSYNVYVRYCADTDVLTPIGRVTLSNFDNALPESKDEVLSFVYGFQFDHFGALTMIDVPGLSAVIPAN